MAILSVIALAHLGFALALHPLTPASHRFHDIWGVDYASGLRIGPSPATSGVDDGDDDRFATAASVLLIAGSRIGRWRSVSRHIRLKPIAPMVFSARHAPKVHAPAPGLQRSSI